MKRLLPLMLALAIAIVFSPVLVHADTIYPDGCTADTAYSATTGHPCKTPDCAPGDLFSGLTGKPCGGTSYLPGCWSLVGYSVTTGTKCDTPVAQVTTPAGTVQQTPSADISSDIKKGTLIINGSKNAFSIELVQHSKDSTDIQVSIPDGLKLLNAGDTCNTVASGANAGVTLCSTAIYLVLPNATLGNSPELPNDGRVYTFTVSAYGQSWTISTPKDTSYSKVVNF